MRTKFGRNLTAFRPPVECNGLGKRGKVDMGPGAGVPASGLRAGCKSFLFMIHPLGLCAAQIAR
ncbi:hypothetical protein HMPREF9123_0150 [Neisseria bacilliformis ATCC BAA-1200]|uniref:Uncharacterized protein n=1 Tax=Neisseria bacilliformis ATCC BAA-1200 TaxID=888742 RepID=F2B8X5_9NEIS|nr:hypothetical protein HMPREF9123_0150 [Neisseria bacilliformis ATCC BAA-1200]